MKIGEPIKVLFNQDRGEAVNLLRQLRPGQVLQAHVIDSPRAGITRLQIGLTELLAKTQVPMPRGAHLVLNVNKLGSTPELQVLKAFSPTHPEQHLLRKALPQQVSIGHAFGAIGRMMATDGSVLPSEVRADVHRLLNAVLDPSSLNATRIAERLLASGLLFEASLAQRGQAFKGDMKLSLMLLLRRLQTLRASTQSAKPSQDSISSEALNASQRAPVGGGLDRLLERLMRSLNAALARINTQQAVSLLHELPERPVWQFDLPLLVNGKFEEILLRVELDGGPKPQRSTPDSARWNAMLRFEFANTGWVQANISVQENRVASTFWCERESTEQRIERQLPRLAAAMTNAGLTVETLTARQGNPPRQPELPTLGKALIDDHA